eukprot:12895125-Prorocentrum_lima.AAC.1
MLEPNQQQSLPWMKRGQPLNYFPNHAPQLAPALAILGRNRSAILYKYWSWFPQMARSWQ